MTGAGHPVGVFAGVNTLEIKTAVPENIISQIFRGQAVAVRFSAFPGKTFRGIITEVSPGIPNASAYPVIIRLAESSSRLFPGMTGTVELPLNGDSLSQNRIVIATDAVGHDQSGDFVYVAVKSSESDFYVAEKRNVTLGELQADGYEIVSGLDKNEVVITAGLSFLYDGRKVKMLDN
jgi:RND family efflux transporter MFP subunit